MYKVKPIKTTTLKAARLMAKASSLLLTITPFMLALGILVLIFVNSIYPESILWLTESAWFIELKTFLNKPVTEMSIAEGVLLLYITIVLTGRK